MAVLLLGGLGLVACGSDEATLRPGAGEVRHLWPRPSEDFTPSRQPILIARLEAPSDPTVWKATVEGEATPRYGNQRLVLPTAKGGSLTVPGPLQPGFNRIVVEGVFQGTKQRVDLSLISAAGREVPLQAQIALPLGSNQSLIFDAPKLPTSHPFKELRISIQGGPSAIQHVDFWQRPASAHYPPLDGPAGTIAIGEEARMGWGLPQDLKVGCPLGPIKSGSTLIASAGMLKAARTRSKNPRLEVTISGQGFSDAVGSLDLARKDHPFQDLEFDLAKYAGLEARVSFLFKQEQAELGACALTNLAVLDAGESPPLALLITSDTHRADHLGCANLGVEVSTPSLDALGQRGMIFERTYSSTNVTSPSHAAILTGIHPRDGRVLTNTERMVDEAWTLGEAYRQQGWWTIAVVTVRHLGPRGTHIAQGFDKVWAPLGRPPRAEIPVEQVQQWLDEAAGRPVFIWLHLFDAHDPYEPPPEFAARYWDASLDPFDPSLPPHNWTPGTYPPRLKDLRRTDWPAALYRGEVSYLDKELGRLLRHRRVQQGLVAFTADHGEELDGILSRFDHRSLTPSTLHVPLILAGNQVPEGVRVERSVDQLDIGRTLLDLSGLYGADYPGRNLLRHLEADEETPQEPLFALGAHGFNASMTVDNWHLLLQLRAQRQPLIGRVPLWHVSLHDLTQDPLCGTNLQEQEKARTKNMLEQLMAWLRQREHDPIVAMRNTSAAEIAELSALGYSTGVESPESEKPWLPVELTVEDIMERQP
jgi:arylsulfatase A-like enzyme